METDEVERWFGDYLTAFAACGRGEVEPSSLLLFYGVPLVLTTGDGVLALTSDDAVVQVAQRQAEGMQAVGYDHSDVVALQAVPLNAVTALCRGSFVRRRADGGEIGGLEATYLVTGAGEARRISALVVHD